MISTLNTITNHTGENILVKNLRENSKIISYDFYNDRVCKDFIINVTDNFYRDGEEIYEIKFINNIDIIHTLRIKTAVLLNVKTMKWKNDEKIHKNFCSSAVLNLVEIITDIENHQCKLISVTKVDKLPNEDFVNLHTRFNKCIFINNISLSCFPPRVYER